MRSFFEKVFFANMARKTILSILPFGKQNDESDKMESNRRFFVYVGVIYEGTWKSVLITSFRLTALIVPICLFVKKALMLLEEGKFIDFVEAIHWIILEVTITSLLLSYFSQSSLFVKLESYIESSFFESERNLNKKQIIMRKKANEEIINYSKAITAVGVVVVVLLVFKGPLFYNGWNTSYPIWIPFEINSWIRYFGALGIIFLLVEAVAGGGCTHWLIYPTLGMQLVAQFRILGVSIAQLDTLWEGTEDNYEVREAKLKAKLRECIKHHTLLLKYFDDFQKFYNVPLLITTVSLGLMLCTLGFIILDTHSSFSTKSPALILMIPEMLFTVAYCLVGQLTADAAESVGSSVYNTKWYTFPVPVQKEILIMLIGCSRAKELRGMGLQKYSLHGLTQILHTTFSYFNLMMALMAE